MNRWAKCNHRLSERDYKSASVQVQHSTDRSGTPHSTPVALNAGQLSASDWLSHMYAFLLPAENFCPGLAFIFRRKEFPCRTSRNTR